MRTGRLFWGVFLTTLGVLFLSVKFNFISSDWGFVWNLWPLVFIFWGLLVIIKHPIMKPVISALFGIFIALFLYGAVSSVFFGFGFEFDDNMEYSNYSDSLYEDMNPAIKYGHLSFSSGAGAFSIDGETDKLVKANTRGWLSDYDLHTNYEDSAVYVDIHLQEREFKFFGKKIKNRINMQLNPNVEWDVDLNFGAANGKFDLSPFKVKDISLGTGAATVEVKLGDKADTTDFHVEMGASTLTILLPKTVGCKLIGDTFLVSRNTPGFHKKGDDAYYSDNYADTKKKVNIYISSGVSSFSVKYY